MKKLLSILLILVSFNGIAQFTDEEQHYLDSLNEIISNVNSHDTSVAGAYVELGISLATSNIDTVIPLSEKARVVAEKALKQNPSEIVKLKLLTVLAEAYNSIGFINRHKGDIPQALEFYHKSLKLREELNDKEGMANSYNNIGFIYRKQEDVDQALIYYQRSLKIQEEIGDKEGVADSYNNIAGLYKLERDNDMALMYFLKSLTLNKEVGDQRRMATAYNNIGYIHKEKEEYDFALKYYHKSLEIRKVLKDKNGMAGSYLNIGNIELIKGNLNKAKENGLLGLAIAQEIGFPNVIKNAAIFLSSIYEKSGNGMKALDMYKLNIVMRDSINNEKTQKAAAKQEAKYEYEKQKTIDDAENEKLLAIKQEEKEKQQILTGATAGGLGLVVIFLIFVFNRLRVTKRQKQVIEEQKQAVEQQKEVVEEARQELEEKNQEIMDSITYAKRIQSAILPPSKVVKEYLQESFILYKPKDIVAGDFYWLEQVKGKVLFAAADCTGHGVPGAMVSVVCNNALNRSVREYGLTDPGEILNKTRAIVIQEFEKSDEEVKDGMDIAICSLEGKTLQYAGAHNPLWIIRNGEILETKANKQPIGQFDNPEPYTTHTFKLEKGDSIYIFSDGYVDQFGGEKGKKFKANAFRTLLLSIQDKPMEEQKTILNESFETWRGSLEQIDDVCVIGVNI